MVTIQDNVIFKSLINGTEKKKGLTHKYMVEITMPLDNITECGFLFVLLGTKNGTASDE